MGVHIQRNKYGANNLRIQQQIYSLFSTSGFNLLFLMSIFLFSWLGDGKSTPGSSCGETKSRSLTQKCPKHWDRWLVGANCRPRSDWASFGCITVRYRKIPKNSDIQNICCNGPKIQTKWLYCRVMHQKDVDRVANSVDPDQTASRSSLIRVCTVCSDISVWKLWIITVKP